MSILHNHGCPSCANVIKLLSYKGNRHLIEDVNKLKEEALKIPCSLYILEGTNKFVGCVKVGISTVIVDRLRSLRVARFTCKLIQEFKLNAWDAVQIEQRILGRYKRYHTELKFGGQTELRYKTDLEAILIDINKEIEYGYKK